MPSDNFELRPDLPNSILLDAVRNQASTDYVNRIPAADKAGVSQTVAALMDPMNRRWRNEFIDALVNRIGLTIARSNSWANPLAPFKRGMLEMGNTIEEIQVGLLKAHNYSPDRDYMEGTLFGRETPEVQTNFHTVNRQDFYKVTVNEPLLTRAFLDPTGLAGFVNQLMEAPTNSDNLDEFLLTTSLFKEYEHNGGFYHVNVPDVTDYDSSQEDSRLALRKMRAMADNLKFLSSKYNAARMPVFAKPEDLILFVSPEFNAAVDVEALAAAFNIDRQLMHGRTVVIPKDNFGIDGCQAILTTSEFFVMADQRYESTSQWNPANLHNNYFLHHWQVISCSRFAPAVMFTTHNDDEVITVHVNPTSVAAPTFLPAWDGSIPTGIAHGGLVALTTSVSPSNADQGVAWSISGSVALSSGTYITQDGILHCGLDEKNTTITVTVETTDVNPANPFGAEQTATLAVTVSDSPLIVWPNGPATLTNITVAGVSVPSFAPATLTYAVSIPSADLQPEGILEAADVFVTSIGPVSASVSVAGPAGTAPQYVVTVTTVASDDATPVVYTVNVTVV